MAQNATSVRGETASQHDKEANMSKNDRQNATSVRGKTAGQHEEEADMSRNDRQERNLSAGGDCVSESQYRMDSMNERHA